jgi:hypothetical protein
MPRFVAQNWDFGRRGPDDAVAAWERRGIAGTNLRYIYHIRPIPGPCRLIVLVCDRWSLPNDS